MADILIRGMEMPKDGRITIQIGADGAVYFVENCRIMAEKYEKNSHAVTLPEGHGKLGDLDALEKELAFDYAYAAAKVCHNAPTVIPAEGGNADDSKL